jgi:hypothetical protein
LDYSNFKRIFEPERIAVIGVSSEGFGFGRGIPVFDDIEVALK